MNLQASRGFAPAPKGARVGATPVWEDLSSAISVAAPTRVLLFAAAGDPRPADDDRTVLVTRGIAYARVDARRFRINPGVPDDMARLMAALHQDGLQPDHVLYLLGHAGRLPPNPTEVGRLLPWNLRGLQHLTAGLAQQGPLPPLTVAYAGLPHPHPVHAALDGVLRHLQAEHPAWSVRLLGCDPVPAPADVLRLRGAVDPGFAHLHAGPAGLQRLAWVPCPLPAPSAPVHPGGTYLLTGGLTGWTVHLARALAGEAAANLVLTGRAAHGPGHAALEAALAALGGRAVYLQADMASAEDCRRLVAEAAACFGQLHGVFYREETAGKGQALHADGLLHLDAALVGHETAFVVVCSSTRGLTVPAPGVDAAFDRAFLDAAAAMRRDLAAAGTRRGHTLVLNLPPADTVGDDPADALGVPSLTELLHALLSARIPQWLAPERASAPGAGGSPPSAGEPASPEAAPAPAASLPTRLPHTPVAVVGMAGRYPGAPTPAALWDVLCAGRCHVTPLPEARRALFAAHGHTVPDDLDLFPEGYLPDIDCFDHAFFGMDAAEAAATDPQERLFLETAWAALEDAGYTPDGLRATAPAGVGVYVGVVWSCYQMVGADLGRGANAFHWSVANRVSFALHFTGPSMSVDTACSSSLTALHLGARAVQQGEVDAALVGGTNVASHPGKRLLSNLGNLLSPTGRCGSFGEEADGYVTGEGVGALLLKRLDRAEHDGDRILGVVLHTALNHGGRGSDYALPNAEAQGRLIRGALTRAGLDVEDLDYLEAHGTGTAMGDAIEAEGLEAAFAGRVRPLPLGTLKPNLGHLEAAAGIASVTKVLLQMQHGFLPPLRSAAVPSPFIDFDACCLRLQRDGVRWDIPGGRPATAGISSFGAGGANAHVLLRAYPAPARPILPARTEVFVLSARTEHALRRKIADLRAHLATLPPHDAAVARDLARTLQTGRVAMARRLAVAADDVAGFDAALAALEAGNPPPATYVGAVPVEKGTPPTADVHDDPEVLAAAWVAGGFDAWTAYNRNLPGRRMQLPTYPFTPHRHWLGPDTPAEAPAPPAVDYAAPRTPVETLLTDLWAAFLDVPRAGLHDHFFQLGGHSLAAGRLATRLARLFGRKLPVRLVFEAPTPAQMAEALADLGVDALPADAAVREDPTGTPWVRVPAALRHTPRPLTPAQTRIWFLTAFEDTGAGYHLPNALRLRGALLPEALWDTLDAITARHESLRTRFVTVDGTPHQVVDPFRPMARTVCAPHGATSEAREALAMALYTRLAVMPFQLETGPLLRLLLVRIDADHHLLVVVMHHLISDGWSMGVFFDEVSRGYAARRLGHTPDEAPLPLQFIDVAESEQARLAGAHHAAQVAWWAEQLADMPADVQLPTDFPRPAGQTYAGSSLPFDLDGALTRDLIAFGTARGCTLFMTLVSAFQLLLARYSGHDDLAVGAPIAARTRPELEPMIGLFMNALVLRARIARDQPFGPLLARTRDTTLGAYAHQEVPFEQLADLQGVARNNAAGLWFQTALILLNVPREERHLPELRLDLLPHRAHAATLDFSLYLYGTEDHLHGWLEYNTDLFTADSRRLLLTHYRNLLRAVVTQPDTPVGRLPLLSDDERRTLLDTWNQTPHRFPTHLCMHDLLEAAAAAHPERRAVVQGSDGDPDGAPHLTYAQLNAAADDLAAELRRLGAGPEVQVGIFITRSPALFVALFGVLKAGAAYVPLDPDYPPQRLTFMVADAHAPLIVTTSELIPDLPPSDARVVTVDAPRPAVGAARVRPRVLPDNLAYAIYSSGSTGTPKGIQIPHRGVVAAFHAWEVDYRLDDRVRVHTQMASFSFDVFIGETIRALGTGGTLVVVPSDYKLEPAKLYGLLAAHQVACAEFVPAVVKLLLDYLDETGKDLRFLKVVPAGSDAWTVQTYRRLQETCGPDARVVNSYGVTEASVDNAFFEATVDQLGSERLIPIGKPYSGDTLYILDRCMMPMPVGTYGVLYIGGPGLARGYARKPALTAEKFVPHPFGKSGERLYCTQDAARYLPGGDIEFVGRLDNQVKLRGYRIEPGEIEGALTALDGVQDAVVLLMDDGSGRGEAAKHLVAYVAAATWDAEALRTALADKLPDYMVPRLFVFLERLPVTPNGKLDRRGLPAPDFSDLAVHAYRAPETDTERFLAEVWADLLQVSRIGLDDNFFELGGHSLLVTRVLARLRGRLGVDLPLRTFFAHPTIGELAAHCVPAGQESDRAEADRTAIPVVPRNRDGEPTRLPLSLAQERLWLFDRVNPGSVVYTISAAVGLEGPLRPELLQEALAHLTARHETLRTCFGTDGPEARAVVLPAWTPDWAVVPVSGDTVAERETAAEAVARADAARPFDLSAAPAWRVRLYPTDAHTALLVVHIHHILADAWSLNVFAEELMTCYEALAAGQTPQLPPLPVQYGDFAVWERGLPADRYDADLAWWRAQLDGAEDLELPTDHPRPPEQNFAGSVVPFRLAPETAAAVTAVARSCDVTPFMLLKTVFDMVLARYAHRRDLLVGVPVGGRRHEALDRQIGFFIGMVVFRTRLDDVCDLAGLAARTRAVALEAFAHDGVPFQRLVEHLKPPRDPSRNPLFQVVFQLLERPEPAVGPSGLRLVPRMPDWGIARFDIGLDIVHSAGRYDGYLEYATALWDAPGMRRFAGHFTTLLAAALADPAADMWRLPLVPDDERRTLLEIWNATRRPFPAETDLARLFERHVALNGAACAAEDGDRTLSYAALNARANVLAAALWEAGVRPGAMVGVCAERSLELTVALVAVLKLGAAYVPLDHHYPEDRLTYILADTRPTLLLAQDGLLNLPDLPPVMRLHADSGVGPDPGNPGLDLPSGLLVYVMYTSGSTGRPKGVAVTHRGVARLVIDNTYIDLTAADRILQINSFAFDAATFEFWGALLNGAAVVMMQGGVHQLPEVLRGRRISILSVTSQVFNLMVDQHLEELLLPRRLIVGGDVVSLPHVRTYLAHARGPRLITCYGPTESTTFASSCYLDEHTTAYPAVPIGYPIANTTLYALDPHLAPVPCGVFGELYIGGEGLAMGYLNKPRETAEKFVPHPFADTPGSRLYRSGDLARLLADGLWAFGGRRDFQLKLRGYRIELGEIENTLCAHEGVRQAAVRPFTRKGGDKYLVAWYVPVDRLEPAALIAYLHEHLPEWMVPDQCIPLETMPLNTNGKVDAKRLPPPHQAGTPTSSQAGTPTQSGTPTSSQVGTPTQSGTPTSSQQVGTPTQSGTPTSSHVGTPTLVSPAEAPAQAPSNPFEAALHALFADLLDRTDFGVHDNFFDLGGHSLLATRLAFGIGKQFRVELPMDVVMKQATVARLAAAVMQGMMGGMTAPSAPEPEPASDPSAPEPASAPAVEPEPTSPYAPSSMQRSLWFIDRLEPGNAVYHIPAVLDITGPLDADALEAALRDLAARHAGLRTRFVDHDGSPLAVVDDRVFLQLARGDAAAPAADDADAFAAYLRARTTAPFDLATAPLARFELLSQDAERHVLLAVWHHIIADGWSVAVFFRELRQAYAARRDGHAPQWAHAPAPYAAFAAHQAAYLAGPAHGDDMAFWREHLGTDPAPLELPVDRPRPAGLGGRGALLRLALPKQATAALRALFRAHDTTPTKGLMAAFQLLMLRYSGQDEVVVGTPVAGRDRPEWADLFGYCVNTLAVRVHQDAARTTAQWLDEVRTLFDACLAHAACPFPLLVAELAPVRTNRNPLFQVMFALQHGDDVAFSLGEARVQARHFDPGVAHFDLTLIALDGGPELGFLLQYNTDLFDAATMARLGRHWLQLLTAMTEAPDAVPGAYDLADAAERTFLLTHFNQTFGPYPRAADPGERVAENAAAQPHAVAVIDGDTVWTYADLHDAAGRVAAALRAGGVRPGDAVALCVPRGHALIAAVLGIVRAGGYYVPIDAAYPEARTRYMLQDTAARVLLADDAVAVPERPGLTRLSLNRVLAAPLPDNLPDVPGHPLLPAYVMYTSGSTGTPKGVVVSRRNIVRLVVDTNYMTFSPDDRVLCAASIAFDASTFEIWGALLNGAALVVLGENRLEALPDLLRAQAVSVVFLTTQLFHVLVDEHLDAFAGVRLTATGGEVVSPDAIRRYVAAHPDSRLLDVYGPTENCTYTTFADMHDGGLHALGASIGAPIAQTSVYVVDAWLRLTPLGVAGELVTGGDGVAQGYLGKPALTAEKFVPDPFSDRPGDRLYRTGDQVRFTSAGLHFVGRLDGQVKLRGFRIEPGEISHHLSEHPRVGAALVRVVTDGAGEKMLIGYAHVPDLGDADAPLAETLRAYLAARLPAHMVPAAVVCLPVFPVKPNGKVDTARLPLPHLDAAEDDLPPEGETAQALAALWCDLLRIARVGRHGNFFHLGGHSLLATRLVSAVARRFGVRPSLQAVFENPGLSAMAALIDGLRGGDAAAAGPVPLARPEHGTWRVPASYAQSRLWLIDRLSPGMAAYVIAVTFDLQGDLDVARLQHAFSYLVARHESLRTRFAEADGVVYQEILPEAVVPLVVADVRGCDAATRTDALAVAADAGTAPFDLAGEALVRLQLVRTADDAGRLFLAMHHIISDGWSLEVFVRELLAVYDASTAGHAPDLPAPTLHYADYAVWQREALEGTETAARLTDWWCAQLNDGPLVLELPTDAPRPREADFEGAQVGGRLDAALTARLHRFCRTHGTTLYMTLAAVLQVLLHRYTGQTRILLGTPTAGRNHAALEGLIGFFVNTLVMHADVASGQSFEVFQAEVRTRILAAFDHQALPFEKLVEALQPDRDMGRNPVFQVMFQVLALDAGVTRGTALTLTPVAEGATPAHVDLSLSFSEAQDGFEGRLTYARALFAPETMTRFWNHYLALLEAVLTQPAVDVGLVSFLDDAERRALIALAPGPVPPYDAGVCMHAHVAVHAVRQPHKTALRHGDVVLDYATLHARAEALAAVLRAHGAGPGHHVGVCLPRTEALVVALLAVLKAGATYVPVDPTYPEDRKAFMLEDSGARLVLGHADGLNTWPAGIVCLPPDAVPAGPVPPPVAEDAARAAYLIYTSGSTGRPKGVVIPHACAAALFAWADHWFDPAHRAVVAAGTSVCFDLSVFEIFATLAHGDTVLFLENILDLPRAPGADTVTLVNTVPSAMAALLAGHDLPPSVACVNLAGEPFAASLIHRIYAQPGVRVVYNLYGPSEDTTYSTGALMPRDLHGSASIGRALDHGTLYLLDRHGNPVPRGVAGEIVLGGAGVTRGYYRRPALTAEKYVPDPHGGAGARRYRTGDLGRFVADGTVAFLGRIDHQVKIRGFRIELGEIEAALARCADVEKTVVVARPTTDHDTVLVAYVAPVPGTAHDGLPAALRSALSATLADYMIPAAFVILEALPLTPNGKIDRRALPEPGLEGEAYTAPEGATERALAAIWQELLAVPRVSRDASFFAMGGHSLSATKMLAAVSRALGVLLPLPTVFHLKTLEALAAEIDRRRGENDDAEPLLHAADGDDAALVPAGFAAERLWFIDQLAPGHAAYIICGVFDLQGAVDPERLQAALDHVVARHEILRTTFVGVAGTCMLVPHAQGRVHLAVDDWRDLDPEVFAQRAEEAVAQDVRTPFALDVGPLTRARLLRRSDDAALLLLAFHHIISDAWSIDLFLQEWLAAYDQLSDGALIRDAAPAPQYADFARSQRARAARGVFDAQAAWWIDSLRGAPLVLELPTDHPRPPEQDFAGDTVDFELPPETAARVRAFNAAHDCTSFMTLLAVFQVLVARMAGCDEVLVGMPVSGRDQPLVDRMLGLFVNTLVLRGSPGMHDRFADHVAQVRTRVTEALGHAELPFDRLVEALQPDRDMSRNPVFQVMFQLTHDAPEGLVGRHLRLARIPGQVTLSHFDLSLTVLETPEAMGGFLVYAAHLFSRDTAERLVRRFVLLVDLLTAAPESNPSRVSLMDDAERQRLVELGTGPDGPLDAEVCLPTRLALRAAAQPDHPAVYHADTVCTYARLDADADHLAAHLQQLGVQPGDTVAVCLQRTPRLITALVAVLKTGAAYVPVDPAYPPARKAFMVADSGARLIIADHDVGELVGEGVAVTGPVPPGEGVPHPVPDLGARAAYVIYTSGSTGTPKGVVITHANVAALCAWADRWFAPAHRAVVAAGTSICFDLSVFEIFVTLAHGDALVLVDNLLHLDACAAAPSVTMINTVPSAMAALLERGPLPPNVACVNLAGEPFAASLIARIYENPAVEAVYNLYGPSEDTTYSTGALMPRDLSGHAPIGGPIDHTTLVLRDRAGLPCALGQPGEIVLGGAGVTRGYHGRPGLTAEKFVPDPAGPAGSRCYRTGDLARFTAAGDLLFLGRIDHQVKLRGFRIELGEIETVLARQPRVGRCVVVAVPRAENDAVLVAYVVPAAGDDGRDLAEALTDHAARSLTDYMVPAAVMVLDALPTTPNGKVDRRALPAPVFAAAAFSAPHAGTEQRLAALWQDLLGVPRVGRADDFFALGGHSLLATRLVAAIQRELGAALPLAAVFAHRRLADLAEAVDGCRGTAQGGMDTAWRDGLSYPLRVPASSAQARLWFIDRLEPGNPAYNISGAFDVHGPLVPARLAAALQVLVCRHEGLRTVFADHMGVCMQVIAAEGTLALQVDDLRGLAEADAARHVDAAAAREERAPFDLERGPLGRARLLVRSDVHATLLLSFHHIITDGWSIDLFLRDLLTCYDDLSDGRDVACTARLPQYADYARARAEAAGSEADTAAWWRAALGDAPLVLDLPTDRPRPARQQFAGDSVAFTVPSADVARLHAFNAAHETTTYMTLLAVLHVLLARVAGQDDVLVGTPVSGRDAGDVGHVFGLFVNTVVMRGTPLAHARFADHAAQVRARVLAAFAHAELPFDRLVEALAPARDMSRNPVFQVLFQVLHTRDEGAVGRRLRLVPAEGKNTLSHVDLSLVVVETPSGLQGRLVYATGLFDRDTVERLAGMFLRLLSVLMAEPEAHAGRVPLLQDAERAELVALGQGLAASFTPVAMHARFAQAAAVRPDHPAVLHEADTWTYARLDAAATRLARHLRALGAGAERPVGVCLPRTPELIAALLAVLKAGAAYVPIDPAYPEARKAYMLADSGAALVIGLPEVLPADVPEVVCVAPDAGSDEDDTPLPEVDAARLAYIIYTSGSTGRPKGVAITHANADALFHWADAAVEGAHRALVAASTSVCFDLSVFEIFATLAHGDTLVLLENVLHLPTCPAAERVTLVNTVPSAMTALLARGPLPGGVRCVHLAGEPFPASLIRDLYAQPGVAVVVNLYGPSEDTTYSTGALMPRDLAGPASIGRPVHGTTLAVVDRYGSSVPRGVPGEIVLGGAGVTRGYHGRPALTAEKFVPDPDGAAGARRYRTGDLGRFGRDGAVAFLGRIDHQVKIRGFRIELGEIEAAIDRHPGVAKTVVVALADAGGDKRLAAYVEPRPGVAHETLEAELRRDLGATLTDYMVPAAFVILPSLPLTPNGKIDRNALPAPEFGASSYEAPVGPTETLLAELWQELLHVPRVGRHDAFFALGGHSLSAMVMLAKLAGRLGRDVPLPVLFAAPTPAGLAAALDGEDVADAVGRFADGIFGRLNTVTAGTPLVLVHPVGGEVTVYADLARRLNRPVYALRAPGLDDGDPHTGDLRSLAARYADCVAERLPAGPVHLAGWSLGGVLGLETARLLRGQGYDVALTLIDSWAAPVGDPPDLQRLLLGFLADLTGGKSLPPAVAAAALGEPGNPGALRGLLRAARKYKLLDADLAPDRFVRLWRVFRANYRAFHRHKAAGYDGPVHLLQAEAGIEGRRAETSWHPLLPHLQVTTLPGDHYTLWTQTDQLVTALTDP